MKLCLCAVAFMCWGSSPQIAEFECPYRTVPHGDITGAQPTLRSVDSIYIFKPTTTVRFHKRQTFAVRIGKLSRDSHLHIAAALWDVGAVGSNRTGNREAGNAAYGPFLTPDCHRSHVSGAFQHTFAVHQLRQSLAAGSCSVRQSTGTRCTGQPWPLCSPQHRGVALESHSLKDRKGVRCFGTVGSPGCSREVPVGTGRTAWAGSAWSRGSSQGHH